MTLRDYQEEAVGFLTFRTRGFIQAPAGSGKTIIGAAALAQRAISGDKVYWLANTREQCDQGIAAIQSMPGAQGVDFEVCCYAAMPDLSDADFVVIDECHHFPSETLQRIISRTPEGCHLWGLSATPFCEDRERNEIIRETFKEFFTIERGRVEASGHLIKGKVFIHDVDQLGQFDPEINKAVEVEVAKRCRRFFTVPRFEHERRAKYQITQEFIQRNEARNSLACWLANSEAEKGESVLCLVFSITHGEKLAERIPGAAVVHSKLGAKVRRGLIEGLRDGSRKVLIATSLFDEGVDVPRASRLILVAGGRAAGAGCSG